MDAHLRNGNLVRGADELGRVVVDIRHPDDHRDLAVVVAPPHRATQLKVKLILSICYFH